MSYRQQFDLQTQLCVCAVPDVRFLSEFVQIHFSFLFLIISDGCVRTINATRFSPTNIKHIRLCVFKVFLVFSHSLCVQQEIHV